MNQKFDVFIVGKRYRVKRSFIDIDSFTAGEILVFTTWGFIPYDSAYGYQFRSENDPIGAQEKAWRLFANKPPETWHDYFEPVD
jgi:hypothetical protein